MIQEYISGSSEDTFNIGREFAGQLKPGDTVALNGVLGAGKTVFVKGIAAGLNIPDMVTSPTFTIVKEYSGDVKLYHFDVYRITSEEEMEETGYYECLEDGICIIEWAELIENILPEKCIRIMIEHTGDSTRRITIERP